MLEFFDDIRLLDYNRYKTPSQISASIFVTFY